LLRQTRIILEMIKFEHTIFTLPFALMSALIACDGLPPARTLGWMLLALAGARSSGMAFNRLVDFAYDRLNPRTAGRALPAGLLSAGQVWLFVAVTTALFVFAASRINPLAFALSPLALVIVWGYSFTKRFTRWSHFVLGLALSVAPMGAWIAVRGRMELPAFVLSAAVLLWAGGFDVIYACQDVEFDRRQGLFSLPSRAGVATALWISGAMHVGTVALVAVLPLLVPLGAIYGAGVVLVALLLAWEHSLVRPSDLSRVNAAFFTLNGIVSLGLLAFTATDVLLT
jgi:4-hydroxybenzoate polyprenyltransferase